MQIMTLVFGVTTVVCAIGWLSRYVACAAMIYYITKKQYKLPDDEDLKECTAFVVKHMLRDIFS